MTFTFKNFLKHTPRSFKEASSLSSSLKYDVTRRVLESKLKAIGPKTLWKKQSILPVKVARAAYDSSSLVKPLQPFFPRSPKFGGFILARTGKTKFKKLNLKKFNLKITQKRLYLRKRFLSLLTMNIFPKIKNVSAKPHKIALVNSFNRMWQRIYIGLLSKKMLSKKALPKQFFKQFAKSFYASGFGLISSRLYDLLNFKLFVSLVAVLMSAGFFTSFKSSSLAILAGLVYVNGALVQNVFFSLKPFDIIKINQSMVFTLTLSFILRKLNFTKMALPKTFTFFKRMRPPSYLEISYKLSEILVLPCFSSKEVKANFIQKQFLVAGLLYQYFFKKQKKFGLGR